jgi:hypothetical protein
MRNSVKKAVVAAIAAPGMATAVASMPTPAEAQWRGGGFHGGWGWSGGCWNCGWGGGWGWGWDPGWANAATAVPVGVAIASQPVYGDGPGCWVRRRVWTAGGHYLGRRLVNICV